ncbi:hypothetical protein Bca101_070640 [Brassica carinata]
MDFLFSDLHYIILDSSRRREGNKVQAGNHVNVPKPHNHSSSNLVGPYLFYWLFTANNSKSSIKKMMLF